MANKINQMSVAAYATVVSFFTCMKHDLNDLKNDERGLSGVVVAVLLILVAVLAVVLLWQFLGEWLQQTWDRVTKGTDQIQGAGGAGGLDG